MAVPLVGLYLPLYDYLHAQFHGLGHAAPVAAGMIARTMSMFCVAPIEVVRIRLQAIRPSASGNRSLISELKSFDWGQGKGLLYKTRTLWKGFGATVLPLFPQQMRDAVTNGCYAGSQRRALHSCILGNAGTDQVRANRPPCSLCYPMTCLLLLFCRQKMLSKEPENRSMKDILIANAVAGASSGIVASIVSQPMDVIKTRLQTAERSGNPAAVSTTWQMFRHIYKNEGVRGLFAGGGPRTIRSGPSCAIVLSSYELLKRIL